VGDPLTIRAVDVTITEGSALPAFTSTFTGLTNNGDAAVLTPNISYVLKDANNNVVTGPILPKGIYVIWPKINNANIGANYRKEYVYGILYVK
jgi:hypothetical protein